MPGDFLNEKSFSERLYAFMEGRGTPISKIPVFDHKELNLYRLYRGVVSRGGLETVIENKLWRAITVELEFDPDRTDAGFRLRLHYLRLLYPFERIDFLGLEDDVNLEFEQHLTKAHKTKEKGGIRKLPPRTKKLPSSRCEPVTNISLNSSKDSPIESKSPPSPYSPPSRPAVVNFRMLDIMTLKKYKKYHRIRITHTSNKKELAEAVTGHFLQQHIDEDTVINAFVAHVKCMFPP
eukprot:Phypoly_transcript_12024.p1 GENE.Phypoly_transcript_12024~~Phypoly_transcript_12024.p1  ORF type:complete len:236 (+),score=12.11 Phypoly_transcript_12024:153-860(+)